MNTRSYEGMASHTPGPWQAVRARDGSWHVACPTHVVVKTFKGSEAQANARLIAAAPELLESAKVWLRLHEQGMASRAAATELWNSGQIPRAMEAMRAAIAKAEVKQ